MFINLKYSHNDKIKNYCYLRSPAVKCGDIKLLTHIFTLKQEMILKMYIKFE